MILQRLRKMDDNYVVIVPTDEVERLGLVEGQLLALEIEPALSPELAEAFEESWKQNEAGYRYLAER